MSASPFRPAIVAPRSGILAPRDRCPGPVFARKRVGDGLSHDPTSSEPPIPVAGTATRLHGAGRTLTIATADGGEVLPRTGIDRVAPQGEGFSARRRPGDVAAAGTRPGDDGTRQAATGRTPTRGRRL